jgi:preprotein translocase subunit SecA
MNEHLGASSVSVNVVEEMKRRAASGHRGFPRRITGQSSPVKGPIEAPQEWNAETALEYAKEVFKNKPKPFVRNGAKTGRNSPCHCGSGKKYKRCHGLGK